MAWQLNGDLNGAEEYYFHTTQANPKDGETLMQYAKLVWELHHDQDWALSYFEATVLASPEDWSVVPKAIRSHYRTVSHVSFVDVDFVGCGFLLLIILTPC